MRIFKHRVFHLWARDEGLANQLIESAINEIGQGLFEANLGSGLYKKRVARKGKGKRSGYRTLIAFKHNDKAVLMYGFAKNECENISDKEKEIYKRLAKYYLDITDMQLNVLIRNGELIEVT